MDKRTSEEFIAKFESEEYVFTQEELERFADWTNILTLDYSDGVNTFDVNYIIETCEHRKFKIFCTSDKWNQNPIYSQPKEVKETFVKRLVPAYVTTDTVWEEVSVK